jgi:hypothetical protein
MEGSATVRGLKKPRLDPAKGKRAPPPDPGPPRFFPALLERETLKWFVT